MVTLYIAIALSNENLAEIFILDVVYDTMDMASISRAFDSEHPLLADKERLNKIVDVMYARIQKTLFGVNTRRREMGGTEQILRGIGVGADDVLSEALIGLLQYSPGQLKGTSWEGLAVKIAHNKAVDALRASQKGLRGTQHRPQLHLVPGDAERKGTGGETIPPLIAVIPSSRRDPEAEYLELEKALLLRNLALEVLSERDRDIFYAIHFQGCSRAEVAKKFGLTSQRIGQIYYAALRSLAIHPKNPFNLDN
ncbi:MAG: sigma-70 family RNA polymerase sigma factor [Gammaproteobacteria bacterium]|nr:sigma-70 family RNA polymerase sigma factor [Gammaproteobacteria bacterium]MDE0413500.1 sigma-70 family RNA polymerase sigma factor [Gammaproteobacteria bacterium]